MTPESFPLLLTSELSVPQRVSGRLWVLNKYMLNELINLSFDFTKKLQVTLIQTV